MAKSDSQVVALDADVRGVVAQLRTRFCNGNTTLKKGELYDLVSSVCPGRYSPVAEVLEHRGIIAEPDGQPTLAKMFRIEWRITGAVLDESEVSGQRGKAGASGKKTSAGRKEKARKAARAAMLVEQAVRNYHKFDGGVVAEGIPPISGRDLAKLANDAFHARSADRWFVDRFGSKEAYQVACLNGTLGRLLAVKADDVRAFRTLGDTANDIDDEQGDDDDGEHELANVKRGRRKPRIKQRF